MGRKRCLAVLLLLAMVISGIPQNVFATEEIAQEEGFSDGGDSVEIEVPDEESGFELEIDSETDSEMDDYEGFIGGESEDIAIEDEVSGETDPETSNLDGDISTSPVGDTGKCGDNLTYIVTEDEANGYTMTISGTGDMFNYDDIESWYEKYNQIDCIVIEDGVTSIGDYFFYNWGKLKRINISNSVISIGKYAFYDCNGLEYLMISEGITSIGYSAFQGCDNLRDITLPKCVTSIGEYAFANCSSIENIVIPNGLTSISDGMFADCGSLKSIVIPDSVTKIEAWAFRTCDSLKSIIIPNSVTMIGDSAFELCKNLENLVIPDSVMSIDMCAFRSCISLKSITISNSVTRIEYAVFENCRSLENVIVPNGVTYIAKHAFSDCVNLKSIIIPKSVTSIDWDAFEGCKNITIYGYNSYVEAYAKEKYISFISLDESIGNCDYDYSSELDKWLLNKGTSNSFNYLVKETNFLCPVSVVANDADFAAGVTEAISNLAYRGLDGWKELANGATSRDQAREILVALLNAQSADVRGLAEEETGQKLSKLYVKTFQKGNWAYATAFGLNSTEINQLASVCQEDKIADFFAHDNYVSISGYLQLKGGFAEDSKVVKCIESFGASKEMLGALSDELELWGNVLKIGSITEETINYIYNIKSLLAADEMYSEMLKYIQNNCPYTPVRDAAGDLYNVIHGGAADQIRYASRSIAEAVEEKAVDAALKFLMKSVPYGELINDTYHYAVDLSNMLFKTKDIQQQKDNMRCVAYASRYISRWLIDCRSKYLTGAASEKSADARRTVYGYYMLLQIRIAGEESFQKLMEITKKNNKRAYNVSKGIIETLKSNEKWMKDSGVLDEMSTSIVACPVDVSIYDSAGNCVYTLYDGAETSGYLNGIYYSVSYQPLDDDYIKVIRLPQNSGYTLKCNANDLGSVDYSLLTISDDGEMEKQEINNIPVDKGNTILVSDTSGQNTECSLEKEGEKVKEYKPEASSDQYIPVEALQVEKTELNLKPREKSLLNVQILPENATEKQLIWSSSDEGIVTVNSDGVISGKAAGKAAVTAKILNEEKTVTFYITVAQETQTDPGATPTPAPKPSPAPIPSTTPSPSPSAAPVPSQTPSPSPTQPSQCVHNWSTWKVIQKADVFTSEKQERSCSLCGKKEQKTGKKLTPFMKVNASTVTLKVKQSTSGLKVTQMAAGDSIASWKSSNSKIVRVSKTGRLTAQKKVGKATITVTLKSGISKKISVKVQKSAVKTTKITGLPSKITLNKGSQKVLKPIRQPFTSVEKITYSSSNKKVVSVTSKGKLKAIKAGTAKITVKAGKKKFVIKVTVPKKKK